MCIMKIILSIELTTPFGHFDKIIFMRPNDIPEFFSLFPFFIFIIFIYNCIVYFFGNPQFISCITIKFVFLFFIFIIWNWIEYSSKISNTKSETVSFRFCCIFVLFCSCQSFSSIPEHIFFFHFCDHWQCWFIFD